MLCNNWSSPWMGPGVLAAAVGNAHFDSVMPELQMEALHVMMAPQMAVEELLASGAHTIAAGILAARCLASWGEAASSAAAPAVAVGYAVELLRRIAAHALVCCEGGRVVHAVLSRPGRETAAQRELRRVGVVRWLFHVVSTRPTCTKSACT
jgi:hypothetical protein